MEMDDELRRVLERYVLFSPSPRHAVTYYLPRLVSGEPLPAFTEPLIHRADVYGCDPDVLAAQFGHVPLCGDTGDRFFFSPCKRLKGRGKRSQRTVGDNGGSWSIQHTKPINDDEGVMVGEHKTFAHFKSGKKTEWLMDEYHCCVPCPQEALAADVEMVLCRIHLKRSKAKKRPAPVADDLPCVKKTRTAPSSAWTPPVVHPACSPAYAPPLPPAYAPPRPLAYAPPPPPAYAPPLPPAYAPPRPLAYAPPPPPAYAPPLPPAYAPPRPLAYAPPPPPAYAPPLPPAYVPLQVSLAVVPAPATPDGDDGDQDRYECTLDELLGICDKDNNEEAPPVADDKQPEEVADHDHSLEVEDEFGFIQDHQELMDNFSNFEMSYEDMFGGDEKQLPLLVSDDDDGGIPTYDEAKNMDMHQFASSLGQDGKEAEDSSLSYPFTSAEFNETIAKLLAEEN